MTPWNKGKTGYMGANRTSFKKGDNSVPLEERFWAKVNRSGLCWLWTGAKNNKGYGRIAVNRKSTLAHRVSYELAHEVKVGSSKVLHTCDVPACVNPAHLTIGTQKDNLMDMARKGRWGNQYKKNI